MIAAYIIVSLLLFISIYFFIQAGKVKKNIQLLEQQELKEYQKQVAEYRQKTELSYRSLLETEKELENLQYRVEDTRKKLIEKEHSIREAQKEVQNLSDNRLKLTESFLQEKEKIKESYNAELETLDNSLESYKEKIDLAKKEYLKNIEDAYNKVEQDFDTQEKSLKEVADAALQEKDRLRSELDTLVNTLAAGTQAILREEEKKRKLDFYKLSLTDKELRDIKILNDVKLSLSQPIILNKLIWSTYFQKQTTALCNRVFGAEVKCGIYKITNLETQQCYIGQSVNIAERIKTHCRSGCDINAPATNRLYQDMIRYGIWNYTFELIEECSREELNDKERQWIAMYQSDIYGLNSNSGIGTGERKND